MAYTTIDDPTIYFNTKLYTGTGSELAITGLGFQPDWVWSKNRDQSEGHRLFDSVRGATKFIRSNNSDAEGTAAQTLKSFDSDGVTIGTDADMNTSSEKNVLWNWLAGGSASSNSNGTITSSVSASTTAGFSVVSYTGTNNNQTVGHGLGAAPKVIILKNRSTTNNWCVGHGSLGFTKHLALNETDAVGTSSVRFQDTAPTSTVYSVGAAGETNGSGNNIIAYCFAEKKGYSKFGSYTGNGSTDGTFVFCGFKPAFVILKCSSAISKWLIMDNKRPTSGGNPNNARLFADVSNTESTTSNMLDFCSNGFKLRTTDTDHNASGSTNIYMAFAESPFVNSNGLPNNAK